MAQTKKSAIKAVPRKKKVGFSTAPTVPGTGGVTGLTNIAYSINEEQQRIAKSKAALFGRITYGSGPTADFVSTYPASSLTPQSLSSIYQQCKVSGYMQLKADLDEQVMSRDMHLASVDRARRVGTTSRQFRTRPANATSNAVIIKNYVQSVVEGIDRFSDSCYELLSALHAGFSLAELVWKTKTVRFAVEKDKTAKIKVPVPIQIDWVNNRHVQFDVNKDIPLINQGNGYIKLEDAPHKFIYHVVSGDGQARMRGYMWQVAWGVLWKNPALARWAVCLDLFGVPSIWIKNAKDIFENPERKAEYLAFAQELGQGRVGITTDDLEVEIKDSPTGLDARGMHAALIGLVNSEMSKVVLGSTLTTELSQTGSYNAAAEHAMVKESFIRQDAVNLGNTLRTYLFKPILERACYLYDEEGNIIDEDPEGLAAILGIDAEEVLSLCPYALWKVERDQTPADRIAVYDKMVNQLGMAVDQEQVYEEFGIDPPKEGGTAIPGATLAGAASILQDKNGEKSQKSSVDLTATAQGAVVKVNEARHILGLPSAFGADGDLAINAFMNKTGGIPVAETENKENSQ